MKLGNVLAVLAGALLLAVLYFGFSSKAEAQVPAIQLEWTAPGDDSTTGTAASYSLRYSTTRPDTTSATALAAWWSAALEVPTPPMPVPLVAGTKQSVTITNTPNTPLAFNTTYYFLIRATDDGLPQADGVPRPNTSGYSNLAVKVLGPPPDTTPPARIRDLFAR